MGAAFFVVGSLGARTHNTKNDDGRRFKSGFHEVYFDALPENRVYVKNA